MTTTVQFVSLVGFTVTEHYQAILLLGLAFAVASAYQFLYGNRPNNHLPTIDAHLSLPERTTKWLRDARSVLHEGYTKVRPYLSKARIELTWEFSTLDNLG